MPAAVPRAQRPEGDAAFQLAATALSIQDQKTWSLEKREVNMELTGGAMAPPANRLLSSPFVEAFRQLVVVFQPESRIDLLGIRHIGLRGWQGIQSLRIDHARRRLVWHT